MYIVTSLKQGSLDQYCTSFILNTVKSHQMNIVYSYLTHHVYNRNSKLDIFTGLKMSPYLFCLTFVTDKDSL